jgi:hypothetical protein
MPLQKCTTKSGKAGTKAGKGGKCYANKSGGKKKAIKQELAIARSQGRKPHL